jgi:nicotinamidase-related amidase
MRGSIPWQRPRAGRYVIGEWEIEGRATVLLLLDFQVAHVDGERGVGPAFWSRYQRLASYYYQRLRNQALPAAVSLLSFFREHGLPVVHCRSGLALPEGRDLAPWSWRAAQFHQPWPSVPHLLPPGAAERAIWPALEPRANELVLDKQTLSPFNSTALDQYLRNMGIENVVIAGVLSNGAVETAARGAGDRGYNAMVIEDACAAFSPEDHRAGTEFASWYVVKSKDELLEQLAPLVAPRPVLS